MPREISDIKNVSLLWLIPETAPARKSWNWCLDSSLRFADARMLHVCFHQLRILPSNYTAKAKGLKLQRTGTVRMQIPRGEADGHIAARIKRNKKTSMTKFKVRCQRNLYTLVLKDSEKVDKLKQSLPPSTFPPRHPLTNPQSNASPGKTLRVPVSPRSRIRGFFTNICCSTDLIIADTPKKNAKGKRVAWVLRWRFFSWS